MASRRRPDLNPKLHMDRQPTAARITDPSLPAGKRREIDNVMKKARANTTNDYWDKKLIEAEEKDPNRWRHTGYKKMYIQGESSSGESERDTAQASYSRYPGAPANSGPPPPSSSSSARYGRSRSPHSRSRSRLRKSPPLSPPPPSHARRRSPPPQFMERRPVMSPPSPHHNGPPPMRGRPRSPPMPPRSMPRSPNNHHNSNAADMLRRPGNGHGRPRSPPEPVAGSSSAQLRRKPANASRSPLSRRRSPPLPPPSSSSASNMDKRGLGATHILPRSKRPPSPPPRHSMRSRSNSSMSSSSDDSCSLCSPSHRHRSRSRGPRSPPPKPRGHYRGAGAPPPLPPPESHGRLHGRPTTPPPVRGGAGIDKYREAKMRHISHERGLSSDVHMKVGRASRHSPPPEDPRLKHRPPEPPEPAAPAAAAPQAKKKKKEKELRTRVKIEGEKRKKHSSATVTTSAGASGNNANSSSDSDDSGGSDSDEATPALPSFSATTRLTLSERFGKMAQWSIDRSNMENMRITKDSAGGALKVMIEEGLESPPRRYSYSPAPAGHFPEELATTAPSGMLSWDDVRVRYEYYKSRGYLRDLDLKDYIKWEEWWYKYQEWLKQERYYEYWDRSQQLRRRRKKLPVTQRLN
ncbi:serine/arginine repetitive matrix protein 1 isoform X1 [Drosophila hydei]|uniref:Serine/arginine repetitive matrix protein 1 isoform X1 n=2 Tax=Drosophila hydei TaxID=7224 RepID=A0A6J1LNB6_DROHY|nr:serine/arginine repetitive matrix protein 1 isoform X1 [Drosophila hydei]